MPRGGRPPLPGVLLVILVGVGQEVGLLDRQGRFVGGLGRQVAGRVPRAATGRPAVPHGACAASQPGVGGSAVSHVRPPR